MDLHLNFSPRPASPSSSLSLANQKTRKAGSPVALTSAKEWHSNGELVVLSQGEKSFTSKSAIKWLRQSPKQQRPRLSYLRIKYQELGPSHEVSSRKLNTNGNTKAALRIKYQELGPSHEVSSRKLNTNGNTKAAQELAKSGPKSPNKLAGHLKYKDENPVYDGSQLRIELQKDSARWIELASKHAQGEGRRNFLVGASKRDDTNDNGDFRESRAPGRGPQAGASWWPYAVACVSLACSVVTVKGIESGSAHASVGRGIGNGQQPPSGSGGGGWGDNGGFDPGSSGENFFGDLIYGPETKREEDVPRSVTSRRRIPDRLSARALASLSSAAGDLMDGDAPIGGGMGGRGRIIRGPDEAHHIRSQSHFSTAEVAFDGMREGPREPMSRNYEQTNPFFSGGDGRAQERPSTSPSSLEDSVNSFPESRGRDAAFPTMGRSTGFNPSSTHFPGSKQPQHYHQNYAQGNEFSKTALRGDDDYFHIHGTTGRDTQEFSCIRGKITEIPGFAQEGVKHTQSRTAQEGNDFSSWLGGHLKAMFRKRTGGADLGKGGPPGDEDGKRELVAEVSNRTLQMIKDKSTEHGLAKSSETGALRRLQREAFSDLLKIRERLEKLEHLTGTGRGKNSGDALAGGLKTTLKGEVNVGGAYVLVDDLTTNLARYSLQHAGLLTGLDVRFTFQTPVRENDLLITQCGVAGQASGELDSNILGGPICLQKVSYVAQINDALSLAVAPLGAKASDMAETVNHLQGQAVTSFAGSGPTMFQHCRGSAIGASLRSSSAMLSMSQFLSGWANRALDTLVSGPLCLSTLAQIMVQPSEHMVFSLSLVNNLWPSPPLPSSSGFHWSEMGPMVFCKTITRPTQPSGTFTVRDLLPTSSSASFLSQVRIPERDHWSPDAESRGLLGSGGTSMQSVAFSGELDLGGHVSIGGWAQVERADWLEELERKDFQWNLSLAKSSGPNVHWGLSMGRRKRDDWVEDGSVSPRNGSVDCSSSQFQLEAFVKLKAGRGLSLQPGLVYILDKDTQTPAFMLRSSWTL